MKRIQVLEKAVKALQYVADNDEATVGQIAAATGEPRGTMYRVLANLEALGLLDPGHVRGTYRLGLKLFDFGAAVSARFSDARQASLPVMERIHARTGQTLFLSVRRGYEALCVERIDGTLVREMLLRAGVALPLHFPGTGHVLLAYEGPAFWDEYLANMPTTNLNRIAPQEPETLGTLAPKLERVLAAGYSMNREYVIPGFSGIAAPIFDYTETIRGALAISGPTPSILDGSATPVAELVIEGARDISRTLGFDKAPDGGRSAASPLPPESPGTSAPPAGRRSNRRPPHASA